MVEVVEEASAPFGLSWLDPAAAGWGQSPFSVDTAAVPNAEDQSSGQRGWSMSGHGGLRVVVMCGDARRRVDHGRRDEAVRASARKYSLIACRRPSTQIRSQLSPRPS